LRAQKQSLRDFAARVGTPQPNFTEMKQGKRPVPMDHVDRWADVLGLTGADRDHFLDLADRTSAGERTQALIAAAEEAQGATLRELATKQASKHGKDARDAKDAPKG